VLAAAGVLLMVGGVLYFRRTLEDIEQEARRGRCGGNLKRLSLALANYADDFGCLPPAYIADERGEPIHSWRVLILPYLEEHEFYEAYSFSEPWNSAHNLALAESAPARIVEQFQCPCDLSIGRNCTSYVAIVGPETLWPDDRMVSYEELAANRTRILLTEVQDSGIHWLEPRDLHYEDACDGLLGSSPHAGFVHIALPICRWGILEDSRLELHADRRSLIIEHLNRQELRREPDETE
jgi:hypothetical protein